MRESRWGSFSQRIQRVAEFIFLRRLPWLHYVAPPLLRPDFAWPHLALVPDQISAEMPEVPTLSSPTWRRIMGYIHSFLSDFSRYYCAWFGFRYCRLIAPLPFGLVLKWSDGTNLDEVRSMAAIRTARIPAPKVVSVGEHPERPWASVSILMTRLPGNEFEDVYDELEATQRETIITELRTILDAMRTWKSPWGQRICSISGSSIRSTRVPDHKFGPCESEQEFNDYLISAASSHAFKTQKEFEAKIATAREINSMHHRVVFTHGDLALHNVMVHDGHISGFIDWECAGWYPDYWEFTTPLRWPSRDHEGGALFMRLGGNRYKEELEAERALKSLTVDSWIAI